MKIVPNHIIMKNNYFKKYHAEKCQTSLHSYVSLYVIINSPRGHLDKIVYRTKIQNKHVQLHQRILGLGVLFLFSDMLNAIFVTHDGC